MREKKLIFICGLCVIEDEKTTLKVAKYLKKLTSKYPIDFIFKASFDKANRTSINSFRGLGEQKGFEILKKVKKEINCKVLTDVHNTGQAIAFGEIVDVIQIPAFLCRQTDLVQTVAKTGKIINIKKGQFLAPKDMRYIIEKVNSVSDNKIYLTERGTFFGYNDLVVDFRSFSIMKKLDYPVIFDASHSVGSRDFIIPMAKAAVAYGVDGLFLEVHPSPLKAKCDGATSLYLKNVKRLLEEISALR